MFYHRVATIAFAAILLAPGLGGADPTPVPGGATAVSALSAKSGETVFNGVLRIKVLELRDASDTEAADLLPVAADKKVMYFQTLLHNGTSDTFTDLLTYTLADADAVSVEIPSYRIKHINPSILQAAALRQSGAFLVDKDFKPVKLIIACATCGSHRFKPVRFTLAP